MARRRPADTTINPARGVVLVVVAVVIGLFLLRNGLDTSEAITTTGGNQATDDGGTTDDGGSTDEGTEDTTTTTVASRPPAEVPTIVLNGTSTPGTAGKYSDFLAGLGYALTNPTGANADADAPTTLIYFSPGFEVEAAAVATAIGAPDTVVPAAMPTTPPGPIASANVVVVIGADLASVTPTTAAAG